MRPPAESTLHTGCPYLHHPGRIQRTEIGALVISSWEQHSGIGKINRLMLFPRSYSLGVAYHRSFRIGERNAQLRQSAVLTGVIPDCEGWLALAAQATRR